MRLIDADALHINIMCGKMNGKMEFADAVNAMINDAPTVDAVPVVRCGECKHLTHTPHKWYCPINKKVVDRDEFCCWAERRKSCD